MDTVGVDPCLTDERRQPTSYYRGCWYGLEERGSYSPLKISFASPPSTSAITSIPDGSTTIGRLCLVRFAHVRATWQSELRMSEPKKRINMQLSSLSSRNRASNVPCKASTWEWAIRPAQNSTLGIGHIILHMPPFFKLKHIALKWLDVLHRSNTGVLKSDLESRTSSMDLSTVSINYLARTLLHKLAGGEVLDDETRQLIQEVIADDIEALSTQSESNEELAEKQRRIAMGILTAYRCFNVEDAMQMDKIFEHRTSDCVQVTLPRSAGMPDRNNKQYRKYLQDLVLNDLAPFRGEVSTDSKADVEFPEREMILT
ncbi:uncharacterized protein MYCFIDRAFT_178823 [Pseudocercospora fijiensis CIRAD86]|uniref:Uncharacterized protein n=1 Tax=Pseudocercospora fijiensis (strain CIRAD86) TaxID=383855 RepID=M3ANM9_PSEFD|nr:uncharacterized protein MYCFIDRAFT_178823 [Pseudocercospora fijiensis CIRAD86]EME78713.1 hypothetical protein MYCFIDRAFT_178823 [Pseudocercospora fijiensis CIRAD86]